jgi:hypothetical protein
MKERHYNRKLERTLNTGSQQIVDLRLEKMKINPLLRSCSVTLFGSYLLTIFAWFNLCNQIATNWVTNCFLIFSLLLFMALLLVQDYYSERRTEKKNINYIKLRPSKDSLKTDKKHVLIMTGLTSIGLILLTRDALLHQMSVLIILSVSGAALYILILVRIRKLLIKRLVLKQTISAMHNRLLTSSENRKNFMALAASRDNPTNNYCILL